MQTALLLDHHTKYQMHKSIIAGLRPFQQCFHRLFVHLPVRKIFHSLKLWIIQADTHGVTITTPIHNTLSRNMRCPTNNVVCAISKGSSQPAHKRSLVRAFACRLNIQ